VQRDNQSTGEESLGCLVRRPVEVVGQLGANSEAQKPTALTPATNQEEANLGKSGALIFSSLTAPCDVQHRSSSPMEKARKKKKFITKLAGRHYVFIWTIIELCISILEKWPGWDGNSTVHISFF
jgi:hypothetical protein